MVKANKPKKPYLVLREQIEKRAEEIFRDDFKWSIWCAQQGLDPHANLHINSPHLDNWMRECQRLAIKELV